MFLCKKRCIPIFNLKKFESYPALLMFSSWNQIIEGVQNIYKLKDLIKVPKYFIASFLYKATFIPTIILTIMKYK